MIIYPAIDIKDGKCVRLRQGRADESTVFYDSPLEAAKLWVDKGAKALHVVDLDGAFSGSPVNMNIISEIKSDTGVFIEMGGGVRDSSAIENIIKHNIDRVILGTAALENMELMKWAVKNFKDSIAVSIDALDRKVAYHGWTGVSQVDVLELIESLVDIGVSTFVYTDIKRDGMMSGVDMGGICEIKQRFNVNIIASGGVTTIDDVKQLKEMDVYGAIIGKALYSGSISLGEAMEVAGCF